MGMNEVKLHGFVGKDAELKVTSGGKKYCRFSLATTETWKNPDGEKQSKTEWHQIICWGAKGENASKYIKKGKELLITGKIEYTEDKDDKTKKWTTIKMTEFDFCGKLGDTSSSYEHEPEPTGYESRDEAGGVETDSGTSNGTEDDGDIPF
jgi:single-strand DNA-binding protein